MEILGKPPPNTSSDNCNTNVTFLVNAEDISDPLTHAVVFDMRSWTCAGAGGSRSLVQPRVQAKSIR